MKKLLFAICLIAIHFNGKAQFSIGIEGGLMNSSAYITDSSFKYPAKQDLTYQFILMKQSSKVVYSVGLQFLPQGYAFDTTGSSSGNTTTNIVNNYLGIPISVGYKFPLVKKTFLLASLGAIPSFFTGSTGILSSILSPSSMDFAGVGSLKFFIPLSKNFLVDVGGIYNYSLTNFFQNLHYQNNQIILGLHYQL